MNPTIDELKDNTKDLQYKDGYRIVYFYENNYFVGTYSKTIEGFMIGFSKTNPIDSLDDIPEFISIDDILDKTLENLDDVKEIALYNVNGDCLKKKINPNYVKKIR